MQKINVGIVGAGAIGKAKHLVSHREVEGVSVIAVCDIDEERARYCAHDYDIEHVFTDYHQLIAMPEIDAISVCTPNNFHAAPTIAALNAGKHVICEKPLAGNAEDGQAMVNAARASGKILQIGLQSRFGKGARTLRKLWEEGLFGHVYYARAVTMRRRGMGLSPTFMVKSISGGGPLIDIGVHELDVLLWMIGCPKPVEVFGSVAQRFGHRHDIVNPVDWDRAKYDVEDFAMGTIRFEDGLTVTLESAWAAHIENTGTTFFMGDLAGATYHPLCIYTDKDGHLVEYKPEFAPDTPGEFESFHKAIREGLPSPVPAEEVLLTTKIFDAIYESARIGRSVPITYE
ncbi:MAG: Gfo/Idh/MocA family oxidoreductase [Candidatus Poribacteria bacterium]|nr:Gfo/Idh/MocA family oxidoreductase [Candidatus Poribacteria bacterium]